MAVIQWFPGHMAKTINELREAIKLCDLVIEVCDARIVPSSRNPILDELIAGKRRIIALNKSDLSDPKVNELWLDFFAQNEETAIAIDARKKNEGKRIERLALTMTQDILERARERGRKTRPIRLLVAGIPNSGKSTLINSLIGKKKAQTANKPGVTRQLQWLKFGSTLQLLDSPGLLWPKLESREEQIALGACAAIKDEIMPQQELAAELLLLLIERYPLEIKEQFGLDLAQHEGLSKAELGQAFLKHIAKDKAFIQQAGIENIDRAARFVLKSFRDGTMGNLSIEWPS